MTVRAESSWYQSERAAAIKAVLPPIALAAAIAIMFFRAPILFREPRIWAEEGTVYLAYAYSHPWYDALVAPHQGYLALFPNLATVLAVHLVPMEYAAHVTTWLAFVVQAIPLAIVLWSPSALWRHPLRRAAGVLIILFTHSSGEVWLNTINSQFYFSLIAFLILLEDLQDVSLVRRWSYRLLLAFSGFTGPVTSFLLPAFLLRAARERRREPLIHTAILILCAAVQGWALWSSSDSQLSATARLGGLDLPSLMAILWNRTLVTPLFGGDIAAAVASRWQAARNAGQSQFLAAGWAHLVALAGALVLLSWPNPTKQVLIVVSYLLTVVLSVASALVTPGDPKFVLVYPGGAIRYFYVPSIMALVLLASNVEFAEARRSLRSLACAGLVIVAVTLGAMQYQSLMAPFIGRYWPMWRIEVFRWRLNPDHELSIWPKGWTMRLAP